MQRVLDAVGKSKLFSLDSRAGQAPSPRSDVLQLRFDLGTATRSSSEKLSGRGGEGGFEEKLYFVRETDNSGSQSGGTVADGVCGDVCRVIAVELGLGLTECRQTRAVPLRSRPSLHRAPYPATTATSLPPSPPSHRPQTQIQKSTPSRLALATALPPSAPASPTSFNRFVSVELERLTEGPSPSPSSDSSILVERVYDHNCARTVE